MAETESLLTTYSCPVPPWHMANLNFPGSPIGTCDHVTSSHQLSVSGMTCAISGPGFEEVSVCPPHSFFFNWLHIEDETLGDWGVIRRKNWCLCIGSWRMPSINLEYQLWTDMTALQKQSSLNHCIHEGLFLIATSMTLVNTPDSPLSKHLASLYPDRGVQSDLV